MVLLLHCFLLSGLLHFLHVDNLRDPEVERVVPGVKVASVRLVVGLRHERSGLLQQGGPGNVAEEKEALLEYNKIKFKRRANDTPKLNSGSKTLKSYDDSQLISYIICTRIFIARALNAKNNRSVLHKLHYLLHLLSEFP